jgi:hypothetical protein
MVGAALLVPLLPYAAATGRLPSAGVLLVLALAGFFVPDLLLRSEVNRRREAIFNVPPARHREAMWRFWSVTERLLNLKAP